MTPSQSSSFPLQTSAGGVHWLGIWQAALHATEPIDPHVVMQGCCVPGVQAHPELLDVAEVEPVVLVVEPVALVVEIPLLVAVAVTELMEEPVVAPWVVPAD